MRDQRDGCSAAARHGAGALLLIAAACMAFSGAAPLAADEAPAPPALLGAATSGQILAIAPEWKSRHDAYKPDPDSVERIRNAAARAEGDLRIEVIFGSWCSDSREQVPAFIKVLEQVGKEAIPATYVGVHQARKDRDPALAALKLTAIPTFIVSRKGAEIGRIVETPKASMEEDLAAIVSEPAKP